MARLAKQPQEHFLHGTVSQAKSPAVNSVFQAGRPKIPSHLSGLARREFKRVCQLLEARGTLTAGDIFTVSVLAECFARWVDAKKLLGTDYSVTTSVTDSNGEVHTVTRPNPLLKVVENCEVKILSLTKSLGLTPVDRDKVKVLRNGAEDEVIPGSMADLHPEWFGDRPKLEVINGVAGYAKPVAVDPAEMKASDEDEADGN